MPTIVELPFDYSLLSLSEEDEFRTRTPGLHLTDITKAMLLDAGLKKWKEEKDPNKRKMQFQKGFLWERIIQNVLQTSGSDSTYLIRPGEFTTDGIIATPDALNIKNHSLEEWKATAISAKNLNESNLFYEKPEWKWAAGWHLAYFGFQSVVFRIWHHRDFDPTIKQYKATFTPEELRDNKERIINYARAKGMLIAHSQA